MVKITICTTFFLLLLFLQWEMTQAWILPLPGGRKMSYQDGIFRVQLLQTDLPSSPPLGTTASPAVLETIELRLTKQKGYGAFCVHHPLPKHEFLGFYEGILHKSLPQNNEYVMTIQGGAAYLDGYQRAQDRSRFNPVHLNHADQGTSECNCVRVLTDDASHVAFFTAREVVPGEELCFDYGSNYWRGREQEKV